MDMSRRQFLKSTAVVAAVAATGCESTLKIAEKPRMTIESQQITFGPKHHVFGYIGHCGTVPWNGAGRYILCLETDFQDRMPLASDAARVMLIDTRNGFALQQVDESRGWNPQQGTMFYWNPAHPDTQFFFNDRDPATGKVFTVLYDIALRRRLREYRFDDTPVANGGVAQGGGSFMAINYGRLARLRPVTGYPEAFDFTAGVGVPVNDGIFRVDVNSGRKQLVCSYRNMVDKLRELGHAQPTDEFQIFVNHTLWNRESDLVLFYARSGTFWHPGGGGKMLNCSFTMRPDGSELTYHGYVGGHGEWAPGSKIIAEGADGLRIYDALKKAYVGTIGNKLAFPDPKGDKALSADAAWLVHGNLVRRDDGQFHQYVFYRMADGAFERSPLLPRGPWTEGSLRLDPAPCWNRDATQVLAPAIAPDGTRQLFVLRRT